MSLVPYLIFFYLPVVPLFPSPMPLLHLSPPVLGIRVERQTDRTGEVFYPCSELGLLLKLGVGVGVSREAAGDQREGGHQAEQG